MNSDDYPGFEVHLLESGHVFHLGRLPDALVMTPEQFADLWSLHPEERHWIRVHGKWVLTPRWQQAYGADYHFSGVVNRAVPTPPQLMPLIGWARLAIDERFNGSLLNYYEGPNHYIGEHHDSTKNMIKGTPIVTISFGEPRTFRLSRGKGDAKVVHDFLSANGTVFIMPYATNLAWKHAVPKSTRYRGRRISVTLRAFEKGLLQSTTTDFAAPAATTLLSGELTPCSL